MANIPQDSTIPLWSSEPSAVTDHLSIPVGQQCISSLPDWHVTSAKPGAGVDCLLHDSDTTYWQSDGKAPHALDLQFPRRTAVSGLAVQLSYLKDESYTPSLIHIACGDSPAELSIIRSEELAQTDGWVYIPLLAPAHVAAADDDDDSSSASSDSAPHDTAPAAASAHISAPISSAALAAIATAASAAGHARQATPHAAIPSSENSDDLTSRCLHAWCVRLTVARMHHSGLNLRIRGARVLGPAQVQQVHAGIGATVARL